MYISKVKIENIRSIEAFEMIFPSKGQEGWHVIIGDNGAGKSSVVKSIAMALVGPSELKALRISPEDFLRRGEVAGVSFLKILPEFSIDKQTGRGKPPNSLDLICGIRFEKKPNSTQINIIPRRSNQVVPERYIWGSGQGWFSASFGPFRRFTGGNREWEKVFYSNPKLAAHLSAFGEDVALTEALEWLQQLKYKELERNYIARKTLEGIKSFINTGELLPHNTQLDTISSDGVFFVDGNNAQISVTEMSDGYRSILSMTFELIRQMVRIYGATAVFKQISQNNPIIDLPGVVLIDEVDAHLHPTWQVRIGQWFTKYFPKIQFIVTTHSPLICRAAQNGSVWRLAAPGSNQESGQVTGTDFQRLVYGNVLDAYGTEVFGENVTRSEEAHEMLDELALLNQKSINGRISEKEQKRLEHLRTILPTASLQG